MYFPKSKIIPNRYTAGGELAYKKTGIGYEGYYHILANGTVFTGKNPNDGIPEELTFTPSLNKPFGTQDNSFRISPTSLAKLYDFGESKLPYDKIRLTTTLEYPPLSLIEPQYIKPTPAYPSFIRYFVKRTNNSTFIEIDKAQYDKFTGNDRKYNWPCYTPFELFWTTSGESEQRIFEINRNMVLLLEQRQRLTGLSKYITDYTEFAT